MCLFLSQCVLWFAFKTVRENYIILLERDPDYKIVHTVLPSKYIFSSCQTLSPLFKYEVNNSTLSTAGKIVTVYNFILQIWTLKALNYCLKPGRTEE